MSQSGGQQGQQQDQQGQQGQMDQQLQQMSQRGQQQNQQQNQRLNGADSKQLERALESLTQALQDQRSAASSQQAGIPKARRRRGARRSV